MSFLSSLTRQTMMRPALLWSLSLLSLSLSLPCQAESLQQVLEQVRSGSRQEQAAAERQENLSRQSLEQVRSNHKKLQQQLARTQANNLELEDQLLALQQSLKDKQAQLNTEKASLDGVFRAIQEHEQLLLTSVAPHSLWRHDSSGLAEIPTDQLGLQRLQALWTALTEQSVLAAKPIVQSSEGLNADGTPVLLNVTEYGLSMPSATKAGYATCRRSKAGNCWLSSQSYRPPRGVSGSTPRLASCCNRRQTVTAGSTSSNRQE